MRNREESFAQSNSRIVEAAQALPSERGVLGTNWQDIARRPGVSPVTVYRHFRSLSELIPACARSFVDSVAPLAEEDARRRPAMTGMGLRAGHATTSPPLRDPPARTLRGTGATPRAHGPSRRGYRAMGSQSSPCHSTRKPATGSDRAHGVGTRPRPAR